MDETDEPSDALAPEVKEVSFIPDPAYWLALGEFIETFAHTEIFLFTYLTACGNVPFATAKATISGHADQLIKHVRRIWQVIPQIPEAKDLVEEPIKQLSAINNIRNNIVHYQSFGPGIDRVSSNLSRALTADKEKRFRVSSYLLKDLSIDLRKIGHHFFAAYILISTPKLVGDPAYVNDLFGKMFPTLSSSWLYKRPGDQPL